MTSCGDLRILFRAPAGPRRGYGHLVRCRSLARALGVRPLVALRGGRGVAETAMGLGCDVITGSASKVLRGFAPDVLIVDDPIAADARRWMREARRVGCLVVSIHDLGLGCLDADLVIDGSITKNARARNGLTLAGPKYAVLDPALHDEVRSKRLQAVYSDCDRDPFEVLVALGGGPRAELANDIAEAIVEVNPHARVRIAGGFNGPRRGRLAAASSGSGRPEIFTWRCRAQASPLLAAASPSTRPAHMVSPRLRCLWWPRSVRPSRRSSNVGLRGASPVDLSLRNRLRPNVPNC